MLLVRPVGAKLASELNTGALVPGGVPMPAGTRTSTAVAELIAQLRQLTSVASATGRRRSANGLVAAIDAVVVEEEEERGDDDGQQVVGVVAVASRLGAL